MAPVKLFVFDLENTLIFNEFLPELAHLVGQGEEVARITQRGVAGEIDWVDGFRRRAAFLAGLPRAEVQRMAEQIRLVPGALGFVRALRGGGHRVGLITGGPSELALQAKALFGADLSVSNDFIYDGERFTGDVVVRVTPETKGLFAREMARTLGVPPGDIIAFADGAMDAGLLRSAAVALGVNSRGLLPHVVNYEVRDFDEAYWWLAQEGLLSLRDGSKHLASRER